MSSPSKDQWNFDCVTVASVDFIKLPLKDILESLIKPGDLFIKIKSCPALLSGDHKLRQEQIKLCFIQPKAKPDYSKFDVTLLYTLIRNLCPSLKPTKGWGKAPAYADIDIGDDIERLRLFRNNYSAHADSSAISDAVFKDIWKNLNSAVDRIQKYMQKKRRNVDYVQDLMKIESSKFTKDRLESCKIILEGLLLIEKQTEKKDEPEIFLKGEDTVICGDTARFESNSRNANVTFWQFTWQKRTGNGTECIDTNQEKYKGSSNSILFIQNVSKEDEGEYQAVLSREANGIEYKISSNTVYLHALGERPILNDLRVTTEDEGITIHYSYEVLEQSPKVKHIYWCKNGEPLDRKSEKYIGGSLNENYFTISSPTDEDRGKYLCTISNAVGSVSKAVIFGLPNITTSEETVIKNKSVKLVGDVFVYDGSPDITEVFWTKNGEKIYTQGSGGRLSTVTVDDPSLTIRDVSHIDAGEYQLIARNAVGTTSSDIITIGVPDVNLESLEKEGSGIHGFKATIKSIPSPCNVTWSKKGNYEDEFKPIDADAEEFRGTTNYLPHPKLVVKDRNLLENNCFQIEVSNFVGNTIEKNPDTKYQAKIVCNLISSPGSQRVLLDCCLHFLIYNLKNPDETWTKDKIVTHVRRMISKLVENNEKDRLEFFCQTLYQDESLSNTLLNCGEDFYALIFSMEEKYNAQDIILSEGSFCVTFCFENNLRLENFLQKLESKDEQLLKDLSKLTLNKTLLKIFSISPQQVWWTAWTVKIYKGTQLFEKIFTYPIEGRSEDYSAIKSKILSRSEIMGDEPGPSNYPFFLLDKSSENYLRLTRLITTVCGSLLRDILSHHIKPVNLRKELDKNRKKLEKFMTIEQLKQLYLTAGSNPISPKDLDISVLYMLLRKICTKLPPPKTGWGKPPQKGDNSESAFIERVRHIRNSISAHSTQGKVSDTDFQQYWEELENSIIAMEKQLTGDVLHQDAIRSIKSMNFTKDDAEKYKREIQQSEDPEDKSEILQQKFSQVRFWTEKDRKYFEKSEKEKMKLWSPVPDISTDDAMSSLEGKKILMAEEPSENPKHLSVKERIRRFENEEATSSVSVKDDRRPNRKEIMVKFFPNVKSLQARRGQAILKDDFSPGGSRPTLKKQDSCEVASDYLGNIGDEIKDSDFVDDVCDSKPSPVSEEILTSSDSCSNIEDSSNRNDIAKCTCTMEHELAVDSVTPHPESDCPRDETELQREDSSDQAPLQPPYPAPPYPLVDVKSFTGRSMSVGSCPPIGFEGLCDHPALSITYPSLSSHIGNTSNYSSNYMIEPKLGMPLPDFGSLHLNKDS